MGTGSSGKGGGRRDNRNWEAAAEAAGDGTRTLDGYTMLDNEDAIFETMGLGNGGQADKWAKKLTPEEELAVEWYTKDGHEPINKLERRGPQHVRRSYSVGETVKASDNLKSALDKGGLTKSIIATRSSSADLLGGATSVAEIRKMYGKVITDKGFMSVELNSATSAKNPYSTKFGAKRITYHVKIPAGHGIGQYIRGFSPAKEEQEFLFNRGASFKILGAWTDANGMTHVNLRYVGRRVWDHGKFKYDTGGQFSS